jgi:hypothetical protein
VLACFFVVLLVELADQLLEDRTHRVVVDAGRGERSMSGSRNLLISVPSESERESVGSWLRNLKLSRMSWTLGEKPLKIVLEIGQELLLTAAGLEVAQREL